MKKQASLFNQTIRFMLVFAFMSAMMVAMPVQPTRAAAGDTTRVSLATIGMEGNSNSTEPSISADGRYVAFTSGSWYLVNGDTNVASDIFVRDSQTDMTTRISLATSGTQANGNSSSPSISADGRYVAFASFATNLVSGDTNARSDIFVHDTQSGTTTRASLATGGTQGNGASSYPSISADGHFVAFYSYASNLVSGDTNGMGDIFVNDTLTGTTSRVSLATGGAEGDGNSLYPPSISADGRYVAFKSQATNLVVGDTNGTDDVFVHDTLSSTTTRVSLATDGTEGNDASSYPSISANGRYVAFNSLATNIVSGDTNGMLDSFVHDTLSGTTIRVSLATAGTEGDGPSITPSISADGRYVGFRSSASNLVTGDTNATNDIFVHDTQSGTTTRVSLATGGTEGDGSSSSPSISADGRYVAFASFATNLVSGDTNARVDIFVHDTQSATTTRASLATIGMEGDGSSSSPSISADGRYVVFYSLASNLVYGDTNGARDIFVRDTLSGTTTRVSLATGGTEANDDSWSPSMSADGRYVAFESDATNLVSGDTNARSDIFVHDTQSSTTTRVSLATDGSEANGGSTIPCISADGRYVAFTSTANNLIFADNNGSSDVFVHDTQTGILHLASNPDAWGLANGDSGSPSISADGRYVAFHSSSTNMVSGDTNGAADIFVNDTQTSTTTRVSLATGGTEANSHSLAPAISADGRYVAFNSTATNLVSGDTNGIGDIFIHDTQSGTTTRVSLATGGTEGDGHADNPAISANGRYVLFHSNSTNLVSGDTNGAYDVFMNDTMISTTTRVSLATGGTEGNGHSQFPAISPDGRYVAFNSTSTNLVSGDTNGASDVFMHENDIIIPVVNSLIDPGDGICNLSECTLREAVDSAPSGETVTFDSSLAGATITLGSEITIDKDLTIDGSDLSTNVQVSGGFSVRVFAVTGGATVVIDHLDIVDSSATSGGGIDNDSSTLTISNCRFDGNTADDGGGINNNNGTLTVTDCTFFSNDAVNFGGGINNNNGTLTISGSTFSGNSSNQFGGGIFNNLGIVTIKNSTFYDNTATSFAGGIENYHGTLTISNSTISTNSAPTGGGILNSSLGTLHLTNSIVANSASGGDCANYGTFATNINNLIEDDSCSPTLSGDPNLGSLVDNGGITWTMALQSGSPAIGAGDDPTCEATDQRGVTRPQGAHCDIGAFEVEVVYPYTLYLPLIMR